MITLVSVRLYNFRAVEDATFAPLTTGITGLSGPNGVGKSAFLEGTLWALYGVTPRDVQQASLKRQDAARSDECYVQVEFIHQGQTIIVTRSLKGKQGTAILDIWVDGNEATVRSIKVGEAWLKNRLKVDAGGFTTAVLVRQKELDDLVNATPTERRALIERLSGIDRMSEALKNAREDLSTARRYVDTAHSTKEDVDDAAAIVEEIQADLAHAESNLEAAEEEVSNTFDALTFHENEWEAIQKRIREMDDAISRVERAQAAVNNADEALRRASERLERAQGAMPSTGWDEGTYAAAMARYETARSNLDALNRRGYAVSISRQKEVEVERAGLRTKLERVQTEQQESATKIKTLEEVLTGVDKDAVALAQESYSDASASYESVLQEKAQLEAERNGVQKSLTLLEGEEQCPVCHSSLDDPSLVIDPMHSTLERLSNLIVDAELKLKDFATQRESARADLIRSQEQERAGIEAQRELERLNNSVSNLKIEAEEIVDAIAEAGDRIRRMTQEREEINNQVPQLEHETEAANEDVRKAVTGRQAWQELKSAEREVQDANEALKHASESLVLASEYAESRTGVTPEEAESAKDALSEARKYHTEAREALLGLQGEVRVAQERVTNAESNLARVQEDYRRRRSILDRVEHTAAVATVLDEFRKEQIARIAPELADTATSLISQMTNGRYIEMELDENFTPTVVANDGTRRPASWLSGGELSVVALALRIAIGDLLTGGTGGLLWLDEVLTAQDADRRAALIETFRTLPGRQIVMINHTQGAEDIVDKTVRLTRSDSGGTVVDES